MNKLVAKLLKYENDGFRIYFPKDKEKYQKWVYKASSCVYPYLAKEIFELLSPPLIDVYLVSEEYWKLTAYPETHPYGLMYTATNDDWGRAIFLPTSLPSFYWNHAALDWRFWLLILWHEFTHALFINQNVICRKPHWFWESLASLGAVAGYYHLEETNPLRLLLNPEIEISEEKIKVRAKSQEYKMLRECSEAFDQRKITPANYDYYQRVLFLLDNDLFKRGGEKFVKSLFKRLCKQHRNRKVISLQSVYRLVDDSMRKRFSFEDYLKTKWWF